MIKIPNCVLDNIKKEPLENNYWRKAEEAYNKLTKITPDTYFDDLVSIAINTLERYYKGFLQSANDFDDEYTLPEPSFLKRDHDLLGLLCEIKQNYPSAIPRYSKSDWHEIKHFLLNLRKNYTEARYDKDFTFEEFQSILTFTEKQAAYLKDYVKEKGFEPYAELETVQDL